jgi:hypothetical protein
MAVVVVQTHADDGHGGVHRGQEGRVGVGRSVVRHLQHIGAKISPGVEQRTLGLDLGIAGQHDSHALDLGP